MKSIQDIEQRINYLSNKVSGKTDEVLDLKSSLQDKLLPNTQAKSIGAIALVAIGGFLIARKGKTILKLATHPAAMALAPVALKFGKKFLSKLAK